MKSLARILKRRYEPRIDVKWLVEVKKPRADLIVELKARDLSLGGVRLESGVDLALGQLLSNSGKAQLRVYVPEHEQPLALWGELVWGLPRGDYYLSGWRFSSLAIKARRTFKAYMRANPHLQIPEEPWGT
jgi:hypothetical protein